MLTIAKYLIAKMEKKLIVSFIAEHKVAMIPCTQLLIYYLDWKKEFIFTFFELKWNVSYCIDVSKIDKKKSSIDFFS